MAKLLKNKHGITITVSDEHAEVLLKTKKYSLVEDEKELDSEDALDKRETLDPALNKENSPKEKDEEDEELIELVKNTDVDSLDYPTLKRIVNDLALETPSQKQEDLRQALTKFKELLTN